MKPHHATRPTIAGDRGTLVERGGAPRADLPRADGPPADAGGAAPTAVGTATGDGPTTDGVQPIDGTSRRGVPRGRAGAWAALGRVGIPMPATGGVLAIQEPHAVDWVHDRERRFRRVLAASDVVVSTAVLGSTLQFSRSGHFTVALLAFVALVVTYSKVAGLYDRDDLKIHKTTLDEVPRIFGLSTVLVLVFVLYERQFSAWESAAPDLVSAWLGLTVGLTGGRWLSRRVLERWCGVERAFVVGGEDRADEIVRRTDGRGGVEVVGSLPIQAAAGSADTLSDVVRRRHVDRVIVAPDAGTSQELVHETIRRGKQSGARVSLLPTTGLMAGRTGEPDDLGGTVLVGIRRFRPTRSSRLLKRCFDVALTLPVVVLLVPALLLLAALVRLDSPGPAFFRQTRVGRGGRYFALLKLRSMVVDADERRAELLARNQAGDGMFKLKDDPRITRIGGFLRSTHLDELPQLLNVLRGDMSLVGPRPLILEEDERIRGLDRTRLDLTPGITGPWQVLGSGDRRVPMEDMLKLDYMYVTEWSLWRDLLILARTAKLMLARHGV
ncbi:exopolysaccharide biosynthesis polyprenyl glycosylphosphotransferase [Patulibacter sp. NPDC049589]|uniref:exopolysaccharide biosynthesis polyprenyl glycosylphosphotransferase n=1 Tax=Patulibacter sp. NPDC049589 TaxID=3154731 RepID=UPI003433839F